MSVDPDDRAAFEPDPIEEITPEKWAANNFTPEQLRAVDHMFLTRCRCLLRVGRWYLGIVFDSGDWVIQGRLPPPATIVALLAAVGLLANHFLRPP